MSGPRIVVREESAGEIETNIGDDVLKPRILSHQLGEPVGNVCACIFRSSVDDSILEMDARFGEIACEALQFRPGVALVGF